MVVIIRLFTVRQVVPSRGVRCPKGDLYHDEVPRVEDQRIAFLPATGTHRIML